jgi:hypothetical protein
MMKLMGTNAGGPRYLVLEPTDLEVTMFTDDAMLSRRTLVLARRDGD